MNIIKNLGAKISIVFVSIGIILSLAILILILVKIKGNISISREIAQLSEKLDKIQELTKDENKFKEECEGVKKKIELIMGKIPDNPQIPQAIDYLTSGMENFNLKLISIIPKEPVETAGETGPSYAEPEFGEAPEGELPISTVEEAKPEYVQIPIEIQLCGSYFDIGRYIDTLRYLPRLFTVEDISIEKGEGVETLNAKLIVSIWYSEG